MDVVIAAPSPVPFTRGGAENLFNALQRHIEGETPHRCELIKLPSPESDFWSLMGSYEAFSALDLSHFDAVITTKYPAWMVRHHQQTVYLQHRLRGLYDTYHLTGQPVRVRTRSPRVERLLEFMRDARTKPDAHARLPDFFDRLHALRDEDGGLFRFPGPFAREVVRFLDDVGAAPVRVRRYAAISETVRSRQDYFPTGVQVTACHHPSGLEGLRCGGDEYLFTASRLDGPKRISLLIAAMRHVKADIPLLIAGDGPERERLEAQAAGDQRIQFLGFVEDRELADLYADALAVPYVPLDEDFGLITLEAMMSGKPVITTTDAGGPTELVRSGENGWVVPPDARALAERIEHVCAHREEARAMGAAGRRRAEQITWDRVVAMLLGEPQRHATYASAPAQTGRSRRERLVVTTTFPVYPPRGGGQARVFHLYRELAATRDVHLITLAPPDDSGLAAEIAPGLWEFRVPKTREHQRREQALSRSVGRVPVTDVAMPLLQSLTLAYADAISRSADGALAVVASHPYTLDAIRAAAPGATLWYEAHNVELALKRGILKGRGAAALLEATERVESECWRTAERVYGCAARDLEALEELYGPTPAEVVEVPNGVALENTPFVNDEERAALKERLGLSGQRVAVFIGSWHPPNVEAVDHILRFAPRLPDIHFLILGSVGGPIQYTLLPRNVLVTGVVEDEEKQLLLASADLALNPMASGSGTNLKMLEYFAVGTPVLSTPMGVRGLAVTPGEHVFVAELDEFPDRIREILGEPAGTRGEVARAARRLVEAEYDWRVIAARFERLLDGTGPAALAGAVE